MGRKIWDRKKGIGMKEVGKPGGVKKGAGKE